AELPARVRELLSAMQQNLFDRALNDRVANTKAFDHYSTLQKQMEGEGGGGMAEVYWCGNAACETRIREDTKATCRAIPIDQKTPAGKCIVCGETASEKAFFAKAY